MRCFFSRSVDGKVRFLLEQLPKTKEKSWMRIAFSFRLVCPMRFERTAFRVGVWRSIQLSYGHILIWNLVIITYQKIKSKERKRRFSGFSNRGKVRTDFISKIGQKTTERYTKRKIAFYKMSTNRINKGKGGSDPTFFKKMAIFLKKRCWQMVLGVVLYMSCQRDSDTRGSQNRMVEPKVKKSAPRIGEIRTKKNLKNNLKKVLDKLKTAWYNKWVHFGEWNASLRSKLGGHQTCLKP